jgi:hypothetical protein
VPVVAKRKISDSVGDMSKRLAEFNEKQSKAGRLNVQKYTPEEFIEFLKIVASSKD